MDDGFDSWLSEREKEAPADNGSMLLPGQLVGAYRIVRQLGAGGMGAVYEVEHVELGTHYAFKTFIYNSDDKYAGILLNKFREEQDSYLW